MWKKLFKKTIRERMAPFDSDIFYYITNLVYYLTETLVLVNTHSFWDVFFFFYL